MNRRKWITCLIILMTMMLMVLPAAAEGTNKAEIRRLEDLKGKVIAVQDGTISDQLLEANEVLRGNFTVHHYTSTADMVEAVKAGKVSAAVMDKPVARIFCSMNPELMLLPDELDVSYFGIGFRKGSPLVAPFDQALEQLKQDGTLDALEEKWTGADESVKKLIDQDWEAVNGTLRYWVDTTYEPISYIGEGGALLGYDLDMMLHAARIMGYRIEITSVNFESLIPSLISGKADMIGSGLGITEERAASIDFSKSYYTSSTVIIVRDPDYVPGSAAPGFFERIAHSFHKTFIRENRWKMFAEGIGNTLLITVLSALLGTLLGFAIFMLCRSCRPWVPRCIEAVFSLLERMPVIVFLMVLYYIVFGRVEISGTLVSVVAFTLTFAAAMYGMIKTGVSAVGYGQTEAAYALGYNRQDTFFKIILPQAARFFIPSYRSELIALVKGTAVVGYIAVQDLTKMSDIVRSRTFEAFFPIITTAIIYVVLTWLLTLIINRIEIRLDPKRRSVKHILKGVKQS